MKNVEPGHVQLKRPLFAERPQSVEVTGFEPATTCPMQVRCRATLHPEKCKSRRSKSAPPDPWSRARCSACMPCAPAGTSRRPVLSYCPRGYGPGARGLPNANSPDGGAGHQRPLNAPTSWIRTALPGPREAVIDRWTWTSPWTWRPPHLAGPPRPDLAPGAGTRGGVRHRRVWETKP